MKLIFLAILMTFHGLAFCQALISDGVADGVSAMMEQDAESAVEDAIEAEVEETVQSSVEGAVEDSVQSSVEDSVHSSVEGAVQTAVEDSVRDVVSGSVDRAVSDQVEQGVQTNVEYSVANSVDQGIGQVLSDSAGQQIEQAVEGDVFAGVSGIAGPGLDGGVQQNVQGLVEGVGGVPGVLSQAVRGAGTAVDTVPGALQRASMVLSTSGKTVFEEVRVDDGWRAVKGEWLAVLKHDDMGQLQHGGIKIVATTEYTRLGMTLVRLRVADSLDSRAVLKKILPGARFLDRNHIYDYRPQSGKDDTEATPGRQQSVCDDGVKLGMVDSAVDAGHPLLSGAEIAQQAFLPGPVRSSRDHGTAVAGILVARGPGVTGVAPNAALSVASVMYLRSDGTQGATVTSLLAALNWLAEQEVTVINLSLAGPPNHLLESAVRHLAQSGVILVAAVGNEGPAAPELYPAAYPGVLGVTAVDSDRNIYRWANRGAQVDFAALGVGVKTLADGGRQGIESGTSMAAPVVAAHAACALAVGDLALGKSIEDVLAAKSIDLGETGRDGTYGVGYLD
jgi:minor extracellular protease Epr